MAQNPGGNPLASTLAANYYQDTGNFVIPPSGIGPGAGSFVALGAFFGSSASGSNTQALTTTPTNLTLGSGIQITISTPGTYLINGSCCFSASGATYAAIGAAVVLQVSGITGANGQLLLPVLTTFTGIIGTLDTSPAIVTVGTIPVSLILQASVSATPSAGSISATTSTGVCLASLVAQRIG